LAIETTIHELRIDEPEEKFFRPGASGVHRRRLRRPKRRAGQWEAARMVKRASTAETSVAAEMVDVPALHRSHNSKKQAVNLLVAFARELTGNLSPPPSPEEGATKMKTGRLYHPHRQLNCRSPRNRPQRHRPHGHHLCALY
jgi:hypothetical protein